MRQAPAIVFISVMLIIGLFGCGGDDDSAPPILFNTTLTGTWTRSSDPAFTLNIAADNTYTGEFTGDGTTDVSGTYLVNGNTIALTDVSGSLACFSDGTPTVGRYTYSIGGNRISFAKVEDACTGRVTILTGGAWTKQ